MRSADASRSPSDVGHAMRETAVRIVAAYLANNAVPRTSLPPLLASVHAALFALAAPVSTASSTAEQAAPERIRDSIRRDGLISFIDGRSYKTLKRHLTKHGLDPQSYRERYGLPADYPMVAPGYAAKRSEIARAIQFGQQAA